MTDISTSGMDAVPCPVRVAAEANPDAVLLAQGVQSVTFAEADGRLDAIGAGLHAAGVRRGDRVAIHAETGIPYVLTLLACWRYGITPCPLHTRRPVDWLDPYAKSLGTKIRLVDAASTLEGLPLEALVGTTRRSRRSYAAPDPSAIAVIIATSGSTGSPRAAALRYENLYFSALGSNQNIRLAPGDRWLLTLPLYHVGGLGVVMRCAVAGATIQLPESDAGSSTRRAYQEATHLSLVPTQLYRLLTQEDGPELDHAAAILLGGSAAPAPLIDAAVRRKLPIHLSYGLTEMASQVTTTPPAADFEMLRSAGRLLPHRELMIAADGEILVRGQTLFSGYVRAGGIDRAMDEDGWFHTRDRGKWDERQCLHVTGRLDNQFISGGENIQPEEIERALLQLEGVLEAIVVPESDAEYGSRPVAFVRSTYGEIDAEWIRSALRDHLPGYMVPTRVHAWPEEEGSRLLKPSRRALSSLARTL